MTSMHTFSNIEYDKQRQELLESKTPIFVSDENNNCEKKYQLDAVHLDGNLDPDEIFTCKFCFLIVQDPKECSECSALFCSKCI